MSGTSVSQRHPLPGTLPVSLITGIRAFTPDTVLEPQEGPSHLLPIAYKASLKPFRDMNASDYDSFLALRTPGNGYLTVRTPHQESHVFAELNLDFIQEVCPLLGFSFEEVGNGRRTYSVRASSVELWSRFLRYLYTSSYIVLDDHGTELSCSFLMHAQLYHLGELYDDIQLQNSAYTHISQICELGCSMSKAPRGLVDTLRYLYDHVKGEGRQIHETVLHYCIARFNAHHLGSDQDFLQLLIDVKECADDLLKLNMQRGFKDDSSSDIIQLQLPSSPRAGTNTLNYLNDMLRTSTFATPAMTPCLSGRGSPPPGFAFVHRPRHPGSNPTIEDSDGYSTDSSLSSDFENFLLIGRQNPPNDSFRDAKRSSSPSPSEARPMKSPKNSRAHSGPVTGLDIGPWDEDLLAAALSQDTKQDKTDLPHAESCEELETRSSPDSPGDRAKSIPTLDEVFMSGDDDDYDSDWSFVDDDDSLQSKASTTKHPLYSSEALNDSTETIVAAKAYRGPERMEDGAGSTAGGEDSDWEVPKAGRAASKNTG